MSHSNTVQKLTVNARSPFNIFFNGEAKRVSGLNRVGPFDILPGHSDFFSVMSPGQVTIETESDLIRFPITNGIVTVRDDEVLLFVNM